MKVKVTVRRREPEAERVEISTPFIRLGDFLKFSNAAESGGMAKNMVVDGEASVNGEVCLQRGKKLVPGDTVEVGGRRYKVAAGS